MRPEHDPLALARASCVAGQFQEALHILQAVPESDRAAPRYRAALESTAQAAYLGWARGSNDAALRLRLFSKSQTHFFTATYVDPLFHEAYLNQAEFWALLGRTDQGQSLLRSIDRLAPDTRVTALLEALKGDGPGPPAPPALFPECPPMRLLVLVMPDYDPGLDVYVDGLRRVLGEDAVVEYPWKPQLHGEDPAAADYYPLTFAHGGEPHDLEWVCERLRERYFDAVLLGDILERIPQAEIAQIVEAAVGMPFFLIDGWDDAANNAPLLLSRLGVATVLAYFKREYIAGLDYSTPWEGRTIPAIPFPLSYPDGRVPPEVLEQPRTQTLFWAGNRYYGQRRLYLEALEEGLGVSLQTMYSQDGYHDALIQSHIGLSLCGFGFDTLRYYEIPALGAVPLAERPPIVIPQDFRQGEHGMYFRDLKELEEQLGWLLSHPEALPAMAFAAHGHFLEHHAGSSRARQLLGHMQRLLQA